MASPGSRICTKGFWIDAWRERLGRSYYHFVYKDVLFLCMDTEDPMEIRPEWLVERISEVMHLRKTDPGEALAKQNEMLARAAAASLIKNSQFVCFG